MKPLFISAELQRQFDEEGFVKVPLLSQAAVNELVHAYQQVAEQHEQINIPYITTSHSNNAGLINQVDGILQRVIASLSSVFD